MTQDNSPASPVSLDMSFSSAGSKARRDANRPFFTVIPFTQKGTLFANECRCRGVDRDGRSFRWGEVPATIMYLFVVQRDIITNRIGILTHTVFRVYADRCCNAGYSIFIALYPLWRDIVLGRRGVCGLTTIRTRTFTIVVRTNVHVVKT